MDPARWRVVEQIVEAALASDPRGWPQILDAQCGEDLELRRDVETLLDRYLSAAGFRDASPAAAAAALVAEAEAAPPAEERRIDVALSGRYAVVRELGRGGMATVYLARDRRHGREVALKVLKPELATSVRGRFLREIEIAARLTHPHILPLHDSGDAAGLLFYVMPYVEGETLRARVAREGALPVVDALVILRDVSEALAYAHARGVIHRDVKPDNIMLTGRHALVADFGVAKALHDASAGHGSLTSTGVSLGTPAYMAPEQAVADPHVDHRADLYALGIVAYETLTGRPPFAGGTAQEIMLAHVTHEPDPLQRRGGSLPPELVELVMKCLRKQPDDRWQSAEELVERLEALVGPGSGMRAAPRRARPRADPRSVLAGILAGAAVIALTAWLAPRLTSRATPPIAPTARQVTFTGDVQQAALSPDGRYLALVRATDSGPRAFLREASAGDATAVPVAGGLGANEVAWLGDGSEFVVRGLDSLGRFAGYVRTPLVGGALRAVGGYGFHQRVSPDGRSVVGWSVSRKAVVLRAVPSGDSAHIPIPGAYTWLRHVTWSPDSRHLAVLVDEGDRRTSRVLIVDAGARRATHQLLQDSAPIVTPVWSPLGDAIYYLRERSAVWDLWKIGVSPATGELTRAATLVTPALEVGRTHPGDGAELDAFSVSADARRLAYVRERIRVNLVRFDLEGSGQSYRRVTELTTGTSINGRPAISPDGARVAFTDGDRARRDVYVMPLAGGTPTPLTSLGTVRDDVAWSPNGDRIAFVAAEEGQATVWWVSANGATTRQYPETRVGPELNNLTWSPAAEILYQRPGNRSWHRLDPATGTEVPLIVPLDSAGWLFDAAASPDGRSVAVRWVRQPVGVWLISLAADAPRFLIGDEYRQPLGWEPDGTAIRVTNERNGRVVRVAPNGVVLGEAPRLPAECGQPTTLDFRVLVCPNVVIESDVWIVEDFDAEARRRTWEPG